MSSIKLDMRATAKAVMEKIGLPVILEGIGGVPATELSSSINELFVDQSNFGKNFEHFPTTIKTCMSGNTYITHSFVSNKGEVIETVPHLAILEWTDGPEVKRQQENFKFRGENLEEIAVAVIWDIKKFGGAGRIRELMLLSKPIYIKDIQKRRDDYFQGRKKSLIEKSMSQIEMIWK